MKASRLLSAVLFAGLLGCPGQAHPEKHMAIIGTGSKAGIYYPTGVAIATIVNRNGDLRLTAEATGGSIQNIQACHSGKRSFGIAQSDRVFQAFRGLGFWEKEGPMRDVRSVLSVYPEYLTLIAAKNAGISELMDLKGKRVLLGGKKGGGQDITVRQLLASRGLSVDRDILARYGKLREAPFELHNGSLDAFFVTVAHPNAVTQEAVAGRRGVRFVPLTAPDHFFRSHPYCIKGRIPKALYSGGVPRTDIETVGVTAVLITSVQAADSVVYQVTKRVIENLKEFKGMHPAYRLSNREMMLRGAAAPRHPGAVRYFREAGLVE